MAQTVAAVEISSSKTVARVVLISASLRSIEVQQLLKIPLDAQANDVQRWQTVSSSLPVVPDTWVVDMPANEVSTRVVTFPFNDLKKIESALSFELEGQVPFDWDDLTSCLQMVESSSEQAVVMAAVTPRAGLERLLVHLEEAGITARAIVFSAANLAMLLPQPFEQPAAILALHGHYSRLVLGRPKMYFTRTIRFGGHLVDVAVAAAAQLSVEEAKIYKETELSLLPTSKPSTQPANTIAAAAAAAFSPLISQLLITLRGQKQVPERLYITGGLSRLPGLCELLTSALGIEVSLLDVSAGIAQHARLEGQVCGPEFATCVATALAVCVQRGGLPLNFRCHQYAYQGDWVRYRGQLLGVAVSVAIVLFLTVASSVVHYSMLDMQEKAIHRGFCQATKTIVGREICDPTAALAVLSQPGGTSGLQLPSFSASRFLEMISKAVDANLDVVFTELDLRVEAGTAQEERFVAKGEAASFEATEQLVVALKRDVCVVAAEISNSHKVQNDARVEFNLTVRALCPPDTIPGTHTLAEVVDTETTAAK